jgi:hypothetical protein
MRDGLIVPRYRDTEAAHIATLHSYKSIKVSSLLEGGRERGTERERERGTEREERERERDRERERERERDRKRRERERERERETPEVDLLKRR